jgi:hypothetical protein
LFARAGARLVERGGALGPRRALPALHPQHSGELTHHIRLVQAGHAWILEAAEQRDAVLAASAPRSTSRAPWTEDVERRHVLPSVIRGRASAGFTQIT